MSMKKEIINRKMSDQEELKLYNLRRERGAVIGRFFGTLGKAKKYIKDNQQSFKSELVVTECFNGFLVVNETQINGRRKL